MSKDKNQKSVFYDLSSCLYTSFSRQQMLTSSVVEKASRASLMLREPSWPNKRHIACFGLARLHAPCKSVERRRKGLANKRPATYLSLALCPTVPELTNTRSTSYLGMRTEPRQEQRDA